MRRDRTANSSPYCRISHQTFAWKTTVEWGISSDPLRVDLWKLSSRPGGGVRREVRSAVVPGVRRRAAGSVIGRSKPASHVPVKAGHGGEWLCSAAAPRWGSMSTEVRGLGKSFGDRRAGWSSHREGEAPAKPKGSNETACAQLQVAV